MASASDHLPQRIALVHEWFSPRSVGGAEQVQELDSLLRSLGCAEGNQALEQPVLLHRQNEARTTHEPERCAAGGDPKPRPSLWSEANATKSLSSLQEQAKITMLVHMSSTNITINILLEEALNEPDIGTTSRFRWHATAVGIAALWIDSAPPSTPPFEDALKEGLNVGLDLSREEREFHQVEQGLVLLFHS